MLTAGGRVLRGATRDGNPDRPPLLLCNGIGGRLELFQPFVDALTRGGPSSGSTCPASASPRPRSCPTTWPPWRRCWPGCSTGSASRGLTCSASPGAAGLPSSSRSSRPDRVRRLVLVATGPGALMVPGHPKVLLHMLTPRRHRDPGTRPASPASCTAAACGTTRRWPASCCTPRRAPARPGATTTSCSPASAGPAFPGCASCGRPRLSWPVTTTRLSRWSTRGSCNGDPDSQLHVYHGGHLELGMGAERLAPVVEAFLDADLTAEEN